MCMHWQAAAANRYYEEHKNDSLEDLLKEKEKNILLLNESWEKAIQYHGSADKITHGFFSGMIYGNETICRAIDQLIAKFTKGDGGEFPLCEATITIWRNKQKEGEK